MPITGLLVQRLWKKKDLVHEANDSVFALNCIGSIALGISGGIVVGLAAPIAVPLAVAFGAAAAFTGASLPPRLQSTYVIAKDKHQKKKAAKAAKRSPPVSK